MRRHSRIITLSLLSASALWLTACAVGPDYKRPDVSMPTKFKEAKHKSVIAGKSSQTYQWKVAHPNDACDRGDWWKIFHDPALSTLEERLNTSNQSVATAYANYMQAQAIVDEARASFYPVLTGTASLQRQKGSGSTNVVSTSNGGLPSGGTSSTGIAATSGSMVGYNHAIIFNASWQPDIWGLVRRTVEADAAAAQASAALLASTRLSSQSSLATFYFELRALDTDQVLLDATVRSNKKIVKLILNQYRSGVASRGDVLQAQSQLESSQALAINNGVNRAVFEHAIAVLVGVPAADFSLPRRPLKQTPPPIPIELPSSLLERRPDVAQAERLMVQANAQIGVAMAAYFPTLSLTGNGSFIGTGLSHWISLPQMGWAYGPQLSELLYDGGLRAATVRAARYGYQSTVASYRQIVLAALQNVEDNLATLRILTNQAVVQNQAAVTAKKSLKYVINEYKAGTVPYSSVLSAQLAAYTAEKSAADLTGLRMNAAVALVVALGGGWDVHTIDDAANGVIKPIAQGNCIEKRGKKFKC